MTAKREQAASSGGEAPGLRPLGVPRPVRVRLDARGEPLEVTLPPRGARPLIASSGPGGSRGARVDLDRTYAIEAVEEVWRVAEEWWREAPLARTYVRVAIDGGRTLTLFHDDRVPALEGWYEQRY